ncbi:MAG: bifunctional alpha,alpha-trehalose-phosphate synthase (UDP-forming)/trehalose-phosphatase [Thermodesulfobacteriota bacterium]
MKINRLKAFIEDNLPDNDIVVVSSREPYIHRRTHSGIKVDRPAGGLTSAMDDVLRATGGTWVAWGSGNADRDTVKKDRVKVPPGSPSYTLKRVWLTNSEVNNYYHGYSNNVLWPLCHISLERVFFIKKYWSDYVRVNEKFAAAVAEESTAESIVWFHDYHLCLAPSMLRKQRPELTIMHFWHIPWPHWFVLRVCPQAKELIEGLLGNDLLGFQTPLFVTNFMDCARDCLGAEVDYENYTVKYKGRLTRLKAFPISIDYDKFNDTATSKRTENTIRKVRDRFKIEGQLCVGVDRLEYTKGLLKRLQAIKIFFEKYRKFRGKVTFVQIAVPTRLSDPYLSYKQAVEKLVNKINHRFSRKGWRPVVYLDKKAEYGDLVVYYRLADVAIVSSVYDGMNLVAKEYVASQSDEKGVLILSELAGAAEEMEGTILVNPYDIEDLADRIKEALEMPMAEKKAVMSVLRRHVEEYDIYRWISDILHEVLMVSLIKGQKYRYLFDHLTDVSKEIKGKDTFLFLDYDGTLTPIVSTPDMARLSKEIRSLILRLREKAPVAIISGRSLEDVKERVGIEDIIYAGNHGAEIWDGEKTVVSQDHTEKRVLLEKLIGRLEEALAHIHGVIVEDKGVTASIHFRMVKPRDLAEFLDLFSQAVEGSETSFRITSGKKVLEIRPLDIWNKGDAVNWINQNFYPGRKTIYVGDDTTDEDAYLAIKDGGLSLSVGTSPESDYFLKDQSEIKRLLEFFLAVL